MFLVRSRMFGIFFGSRLRLLAAVRRPPATFLVASASDRTWAVQEEPTTFNLLIPEDRLIGVMSLSIYSSNSAVTVTEMLLALVEVL